MTASASEALDTPATKWFGRYPGTVVSDEDPDRAGGLQIRVDQIYGLATDEEKIEDADLPWARPSFPVSGLKSGEFHTPPIGATVWVEFWGGQGDKPIWVGGWFTPDDAPDAAKSSYSPGPKTRIVRTTNGHVFEMRWKEGEERVEIKSAGGLDVKLDDHAKKITIKSAKTTIELDDNGSQLKVTVTGDANVAVSGNAKLDVTGSLEMDGGTSAKLAAPTIAIEGVTAIGPAGPPKFALMDTRLIALFNAHIHPTIPVFSGPPVIPIVPLAANTANTTAS